MRSLVMTSFSPENGGYITDSIILDLFDGAATDIVFEDINIHPYNLGNDATTVVCDPSVFANEDLNQLGFTCYTGDFKATAQ